MDPHGHSKPTRRIRALAFSLPIMMHLAGGRGVQRDPASESAAISTPTSEATTFAVAERNCLFNFVFCRSSPKNRNLLALCQKRRRRGSVPGPTILFVCGVLPPRTLWRVIRVAVWIHCPNSTARKRRLLAVLTRSSEPDILFLLHAHTVCTVLARCSYVAG